MTPFLLSLSLFSFFSVYFLVNSAKRSGRARDRKREVVTPSFSLSTSSKKKERERERERGGVGSGLCVVFV